MKNFKSLLLISLLASYTEILASETNDHPNKIITNFSAEEVRSRLEKASLTDFAVHTNIVQNMTGPNTFHDILGAAIFANAQMVVRRHITHEESWKKKLEPRLYETFLDDRPDVLNSVKSAFSNKK